MPYAGKKPCTIPGCGELVKTGRCEYHKAQADKQRGTAKQRGYKSHGHQDFRAKVLRRDPVCVVCRQAMSTEADHYPTSRINLAEQGLNPDDPRYGRGLCKTCHSRETAKHQPGGWNAPQ